MKVSFIKSIINLVTDEYHVFAGLPFRLRIGAVSALALLFLSLIILLHLTIAPYLLDTTDTSMIITSFYFIIVSLSVLIFLPILFPKLQKQSSVILFIIIFINFFPLALFLFLIPKIRKYKNVVNYIQVPKIYL